MSKMFISAHPTQQDVLSQSRSSESHKDFCYMLTLKDLEINTEYTGLKVWGSLCSD